MMLGVMRFPVKKIVTCDGDKNSNTKKSGRAYNICFDFIGRWSRNG